MAAIEYGSNYYCVMLEPTEEGRAGDTIHLHADSAIIDGAGTLQFWSLGRRPAGSDPKTPGKKEATQDGGSSGEQNAKADGKSEGKETKGEKKPDGSIFMAFAPGTWRVFYAAKLQDGAPASVEHWDAANEKPEIAAVPPRSGAESFVQPLSAR